LQSNTKNLLSPRIITTNRLSTKFVHFGPKTILVPNPSITPVNAIKDVKSKK
jgi:hypothetical protein